MPRSTAFFLVRINAAGSNDLLQVTGTIALNNVSPATSTSTLSGLAPQFLRRAGSTELSSPSSTGCHPNRFFGLAQNATYTAPTGAQFTISYTGTVANPGNKIVLTLRRLHFRRSRGHQPRQHRRRGNTVPTLSSSPTTAWVTSPALS